jgi:hypothetical protein
MRVHPDTDTGDSDKQSTGIAEGYIAGPIRHGRAGHVYSAGVGVFVATVSGILSASLNSCLRCPGGGQPGLSKYATDVRYSVNTAHGAAQGLGDRAKKVVEHGSFTRDDHYLRVHSRLENI